MNKIKAIIIALSLSSSLFAVSIASAKIVADDIDNYVFESYSNINKWQYQDENIVIAQKWANAGALESSIKKICGGSTSISIASGSISRQYSIISFSQNLSTLIKMLIEEKDKETLTSLAFVTSKARPYIHNLFKETEDYSTPRNMLMQLANEYVKDKDYWLEPNRVALRYVCANNHSRDPIDGMNSRAYNDFILTVSMGAYDKAKKILRKTNIDPLFQEIGSYLLIK